MNLLSLVKKNRSYRRFDASYVVSTDVLQSLVEISGYTASAMNLQSLRYRIFNNENDCNAIFSCLKWAGYLKHWDGPSEQERPTAYLLQYSVEPSSKHILCDAGIAMQTILLAAIEQGLGGCIFASADKEKINRLFPIELNFKLLYVIAIGKPKEEIVLETGTALKYWRDEKDAHHVPKRDWKDLIL
jgi:nitroreductase